jgi:hypothetical protein
MSITSRQPTRNRWIIAGAGCALLVGFLACTGGAGIAWWMLGGPSKPNSVSLNTEETARSVADLNAEFKADPAAFEKHYDSQIVTVRGRVLDSLVNHDFNQVSYVSLGDEHGQIMVYFLAPADCRRAAASSSITVRGRLRIVHFRPPPNMGGIGGDSWSIGNADLLSSK